MPSEFNGPKSVVREYEAGVSSKTSVLTPSSRPVRALGVSIMGEQAEELIHIGQAVMAHEGTVDYFVNTVFNFSTLAECYKTAAFDGINRLE